MSADVAQKCFVEARNMTDSNRNPNEWNMYNGLANLADSVAQVQRDIYQINYAILQLTTRIGR
jgi:hypothetical protein